MQKLAVFFVHGIGEQAAGFSAGMARLLREHFLKALAHMGHAGVPGAEEALDTEEGLWAHLLQTAEDELWRRMSAALPTDPIGNPLRHFVWRQIRRFLVGYATDAIAYSTQGARYSRYREIHAELLARLRRLAARVGDGAAAGTPAPGPAALTVIAHSLGCVITSDFLYDLRKETAGTAAGGRLAGELGLRLDNLFTLGCPLSIYAIRTGLGRFRPRGVDDRDHGMWINLYDPDDVLGLPLRPINEDCRSAVDADLALELSSWQAHIPHAAHTLYWADKKVSKVIAEKLAIDWLRINGLDTPERSRARIAAYRERYGMPKGA